VELNKLWNGIGPACWHNLVVDIGFGSIPQYILSKGYYQRVAQKQMTETNTPHYWCQGNNMDLFLVHFQAPFLDTWVLIVAWDFTAVQLSTTSKLFTVIWSQIQTFWTPESWWLFSESNSDLVCSAVLHWSEFNNQSTISQPIYSQFEN
jgi:hypothetical protein